MKPHKHAELIKANLYKFQYLPSGDLVWSDNFGPRARKGMICGSVDSSGYRQIKIEKKNILAHRIVWLIFNKDYPEQIDHINRNRQDNRIENLRSATNTTNQHNTSIRKDNKSGCPGVNQRNGMWIARIASFGNRFHLGVFKYKQDAIDAYKKAKELLHAH